MKKFILIWMLLIPYLVFGQATISDAQYVGNGNLLVNPSFEQGKKGWVNVNGVFTTTTVSGEFSHLKTAAKVVLTAQVLNFSQSTPVPVGTQKQGYARIVYRVPATMADFQICTLVDTVEQTCVPSTNLILDNTFRSVDILLTFGSSSAGIKTKTTSAYSATAFFDAAIIAQGLPISSSPPRMTTAQMLAIATPATGLTIYNTDVNSLASWNGTTWTYGFGSITPSTNMSAYTPVFTGTTGLSGVDVKWERQGDMLKAIGTFSVSSATATTISLPPGFTVDANKISASNYQTIGSGSVSSAFALSVTVLAQGGSSVVSFGLHYSGSSGDIPFTAWGAERFQFNFEVPIAGWTSNTNAWVQANSNPIATTTEFTAQSDISAGVSRLNVSGWVASGSIVSSVYTFPITGFTVAPNCWANSSTQGSGSVRIVNVASTSSNVLIEVTGSAGAGATTTISFGCQRSGADYTAAHSPFIIGIQQSVNMYSATPTPTTSGTSKDFAIPAGVKRINVSLSGVSVSGTSLMQVQIGTGSVTTTGYNSSGSTNGATTSLLTSGFLVNGRGTATTAVRGSFSLTNLGSNIWIQSGATGPFDSAPNYDTWNLAGGVTLVGAVDILRLTTVNGTDTFDAGNVNVSWEF